MAPIPLQNWLRCPGKQWIFLVELTLGTCFPETWAFNIFLTALTWLSCLEVDHPKTHIFENGSELELENCPYSGADGKSRAAWDILRYCDPLFGKMLIWPQHQNEQRNICVAVGNTSFGRWTPGLGGCYQREVCWLEPASHKLPYYFQI